MNPDEIAPLIRRCETNWAKLLLAVAFYSDPHTYGIDQHAKVRQTGQDAPIDRDLGRVARAALGERE